MNRSFETPLGDLLLPPGIDDAWLSALRLTEVLLRRAGAPPTTAADTASTLLARKLKKLRTEQEESGRHAA